MYVAQVDRTSQASKRIIVTHVAWAVECFMDNQYTTGNTASSSKVQPTPQCQQHYQCWAKYPDSCRHPQTSGIRYGWCNLWMFYNVGMVRWRHPDLSRLRVVCCQIQMVVPVIHRILRGVCKSKRNLSFFLFQHDFIAKTREILVFPCFDMILFSMRWQECLFGNHIFETIKWSHKSPKNSRKFFKRRRSLRRRRSFHQNYMHSLISNLSPAILIAVVLINQSVHFNISPLWWRLGEGGGRGGGGAGGGGFTAIDLVSAA